MRSQACVGIAQLVSDLKAVITLVDTVRPFAIHFVLETALTRRQVDVTRAKIFLKIQDVLRNVRKTSKVISYY